MVPALSCHTVSRASTMGLPQYIFMKQTADFHRPFYMSDLITLDLVNLETHFILTLHVPPPPPACSPTPPPPCFLCFLSYIIAVFSPLRGERLFPGAILLPVVVVALPHPLSHPSEVFKRTRLIVLDFQTSTIFKSILSSGLSKPLLFPSSTLNRHVLKSAI